MPFLFQEGYVKIMKKGAKTMLRVLLWIVAVIVILILICFVYHRYRLNAEKIKQFVKSPSKKLPT